MRDIPKIEVEVTFLTKAEGGREQPPVLTTPTLYRPHLVAGESEHLGVIFLSAPEHVLAKSPFTATLGLVYHPNVITLLLFPEQSLRFAKVHELSGRVEFCLRLVRELKPLAS